MIPARHQTASESTSPPNDSLDERCRRAVEVALCAGLLILASPLLLVLAFAVCVDSPGPALFRQLRAGRFRRPFRMLKFRSMLDGAERLREGLDEPNNHSPVFKLRDDPRLTRVGKLIRRLSLDELPQLVNVLRGEMALVGPRPLPVSDLRRFERWQRQTDQPDAALVRWHHERSLVRPGLTGLWQVSRRNKLDLDGWIECDREYVRRRALKLDLLILMQTLPAVLKCNGRM